MMEKSGKRTKDKSKYMKTQSFQEQECVPFQLGKPIVRLPIINKKSGALRFRYDNTMDRSLDSKDKNLHSRTIIQSKDVTINAEESMLRKYSNNSQLQLLSFEELQLCADKSKKILPKIAALGPHSRQNTQRMMNDDFHKRLNRIKSQKKIDSNSNQLCSYKLGSILGRGNYSIVRLCESNDGKKYAAKVYPKQKINTPQRQLNLREQVAVLKSLDHPNIITFKQHVQTQENHYIIMELFDNISLADFMKKRAEKDNNNNCINKQQTDSCTTRYRQKQKMSEQQARVIFKKILQAFAYLHGRNIAHRDVKLQNVLIGAGANMIKEEVNIKVIDFGFSCRCLQKEHSLETKQNKKQQLKKNRVNEDLFFDYCGTPSYISPEIMQKKGYHARPADIWALGILLFYLVTGYFPFRNVTDRSDFSNSIFPQINVKLSNSLIGLLKKMLRNQPSLRPTVEELLEQDSWLTANH